MGALYRKSHPDASQQTLARVLGRSLAARGIRYHTCTLKRQLAGAISSIPPEVEAEMCALLTAGDGLRGLDDIEQAMAASEIDLEPRRDSPYVLVGRIVPLVRLWLHLNPDRSKRFLARRLQELGGGEIPYTVDTLQSILAGKQHRLARRAVHQGLLALLAEQGLGSEEEARSRYLALASEIDAAARRREAVPSPVFVRLCRLWQVRRHEPSSRRLAVLLRQRLAERGILYSLPHVQNLVSGRTRGVRRGVFETLQELVRQELHVEDLEREVAKASPHVADLGWVEAVSVAAMAREWSGRHPGMSMRQLALRIAEVSRRIGYPISHNSIQPILGGWKKKARRFVYRAMLMLMEERSSRSGQEPTQPRCRTRGCVFPSVREGLCQICWLSKYDFRPFERRDHGIAGV